MNQTSLTRSREARRRAAYGLKDHIQETLPEVAYAVIHDCDPDDWKHVTIAVALRADSGTYTHYGETRVGTVLSTNLRSFVRTLTSTVQYHADVERLTIEERPERVTQGSTPDLYRDNVYMLDVALK